MKRLSYLILSILMLAFSSCTHNDGDIGILFGTWKVTSVTINDRPMDSYSGGMFFAFQNDVVGVKNLIESYPNVPDWNYGRYYYADAEYNGVMCSHLVIDFTEIINFVPEGVPMDKGRNVVYVRESSSSSMVWEMRRNSSTYIFSLQKWN